MPVQRLLDARCPVLAPTPRHQPNCALFSTTPRQDLTTGQQVFLDPRFNLSSYGPMPPGLASYSAAATAGTATGPAHSLPQQQSRWEMSGDSNGLAAQPSAGPEGAGAQPPAAPAGAGVPPSPAPAAAATANGHSVAVAGGAGGAAGEAGASGGSGESAQVCCWAGVCRQRLLHCAALLLLPAFLGRWLMCQPDCFCFAGRCCGR